MAAIYGLIVDEMHNISTRNADNSSGSKLRRFWRDEGAEQHQGLLGAEESFAILERENEPTHSIRGERAISRAL